MRVKAFYKSDDLHQYLNATPRVRLPKAIRSGLNASGLHARNVVKGSMAYAGRNNRPTRLKATVRYKVFANRGGNFGMIVGPMGRWARHRHMVEAGHEMVGHRPRRVHTGLRVAPRPYITAAEPRVNPIVSEAIQKALAQMVASDK